MSEEAEAFKVTDRRRRTAAAAEPSPPASPAPGDVVPLGVPTELELPDPDEGGPDLQGLFVMFANSALVSLGEAPDPSTGEQRVDLDQAQDAVETLLLLRAKTEGNRTEAESRLLDRILYDLQVRFAQWGEGGAAGPR